jgi:hypothetical protein
MASEGLVSALLDITGLPTDAFERACGEQHIHCCCSADKILTKQIMPKKIIMTYKYPHYSIFKKLQAINMTKKRI